MDESKFDLAIGTTSNARINAVEKQIPSKFITSDIFWGFETSPGDRPAEPIMPNRYAPVVRQIRNVSLFEKGIVIPSGSILSALPVMNGQYYLSATPVLFDSLGAASGSISSGNIALGIGYNTLVNQVSMEDMVEGYDRIRLIGTIANGGEDVSDPYTQYDVDRQRVGANGALVTTSDTFARGKNIPIGFTTEDLYIFDDGNKLNFTELKWNKFSSFATDYLVEMPYYAGSTAFHDGSTFGGGSGSATANYLAAKALGLPFFWAPSLADMIVGNFVQSDRNGKWRAQFAAANAYTASKTVQTVGKVISFTNKFPGDLQGYVETYKTTRTGGTATYGLPYILYVFMTTVLGSTDYTTIKNALNSGEFGMVRINVHTS